MYHKYRAISPTLGIALWKLQEKYFRSHFSTHLWSTDGAILSKSYLISLPFLHPWEIIIRPWPYILRCFMIKKKKHWAKN
jgi:hypothetical protein